MATANDKRTHWFIERTPFNQRKRMCNGSVLGTFVTEAVDANRHQVGCTLCLKALAKLDAA